MGTDRVHKVLNNERVRAYAKSLELDKVEMADHSVFADKKLLSSEFAALHAILGAGDQREFLAYRLAKRYSVSETDFRGPPLDRRGLKSAPLARKNDKSR